MKLLITQKYSAIFVENEHNEREKLLKSRNDFGQLETAFSEIYNLYINYKRYFLSSGIGGLRGTERIVESEDIT